MVLPSCHTRHRAPLSRRATSHTRSGLAGALLCLAAFLVACGDHGSSAAPSAKTGADQAPAKAQIEALRQAFIPIDPTATSDKQYEWREARRKLLLELERGPQTLAAPAIEAFQKEVDGRDDWRSALLSVAAHTDRELARPLLEKLCLFYDGVTGLGVRTEAMRLWCETSPAPAVKLLQPILLQPRPSITYPPKEQMLRHWINAARSIRQPIDVTLATIATDITQPADARYVAVDELALEKGSSIGAKALETVLVESGSDGMLRRKAAQAMRGALSREDLCAILTRISEHESDATFLYFLDDMLQKNCR
ncbi:MAG TPA: hypothetical protein VK843_09175 [Planctomycetota bacterium]|nr:hypothetical protein [Planctomycetota bacterium]